MGARQILCKLKYNPQLQGNHYSDNAMTEKEKMLTGLLYNSADNELVAERMACKDLCHTYNQLLPSQTEKQQEIVKQIFGTLQNNCVLTAPFWCDYGYNMEVGENFYTNHNCVFLDCATISFGDNVFIAPNCCFSTATHPIDAEQRNLGLELAYPITVGNDVWFGAGVTVLPGVTIGSNVVIGAGSVVTKDIPDGVVAVGNPCRVLRKINEEEIKKQNPEVCLSRDNRVLQCKDTTNNS